MTSALEPLVMATYRFRAFISAAFKDYRNVGFEPLQQERTSDRAFRKGSSHEPVLLLAGQPRRRTYCPRCHRRFEAP